MDGAAYGCGLFEGGMKPTATHIVWKDACFGLSECSIEQTGLVELHALGYVLKEDDEALTISLEWQDDCDSTRNWLAIPKNRIITRHDFRIPHPRKARLPGPSQRREGDLSDMSLQDQGVSP